MAGLLARLPAVVIEEPIPSDGTDPGHRIGSTVERATGADRLQKRLCGDLLAERVVATGTPMNEAVDPRERAFILRGERVLVIAKRSKWRLPIDKCAAFVRHAASRREYRVRWSRSFLRRSILTESFEPLVGPGRCSVLIP
jgi:hypothetical protein